jgi:hypothetical protein
MGQAAGWPNHGGQQRQEITANLVCPFVDGALPGAPFFVNHSLTIFNNDAATDSPHGRVAPFKRWAGIMRQDQAGTTGEELPLLSNALLYKLTAAIAALAITTSGISYAGRWYGERLALAGHTDSTEPFEVEVGTDRIVVPANMIRFREQRISGAAERLNLYVTWPKMQGYSQETRENFDRLDKANALIFIEFSEATMSRDMSGRLEPIYSRLFDGEPQAADAGLMRHGLRADSGYAGEVIFTADRSGRPDYVVRCVLPQAGSDRPSSGDCQRDIHLGSGLSVLYRFSSTLLPEWDHIDAAIETFVQSRLSGDGSGDG